MSKSISTHTPKELIKLLTEKKTALQSFRLGNARSKTKNVKEGRTIRKEIAAILTALKQSTMTAATASAKAATVATK